MTYIHTDWLLVLFKIPFPTSVEFPLKNISKDFLPKTNQLQLLNIMAEKSQAKHFLSASLQFREYMNENAYICIEYNSLYYVFHPVFTVAVCLNEPIDIWCIFIYNISIYNIDNDSWPCFYSLYHVLSPPFYCSRVFEWNDRYMIHIHI